MANVTRWALAQVVAVSLVACGKTESGDAPATSTPTTSETKAATGVAPKQTTPTAAAAPTEAAPVATGPLARINGVELPREEFDSKYAKMTKAFTARQKEIPEGLARRYMESILKQLVEKELLRQKIEGESIQVDAAALEQELAEYKKMFRTEENFDRYLKSASVSLDQIKENIGHNLAVNQLLEKTGELVVKDDEVREYYEQNKARYEVKEQVRASHILLKVKSKDDKAEDEAARKKAEVIHKEAAKKDADFAALAKEHSQGPTAPRGGDLSYFTRGRMVPEFEKVAFTMKVGEVSAPVRTQFGWHIIKITDRKEGRQRPFDEVKESIEKLLVNKKTRKAKAELVKKLRAEAKIETFLPELADADKALAGPDDPFGSPDPADPEAAGEAAEVP